ncbi:hypothetical protein [Anabaena azotica]|uniref:Uncharacterized protein n=1 Tax=Anabaena azotica FACHB-119 TaxID=947527 RepID=A0ABR8DB79_9NOST|nr:hypothetical protein [Anabaena azotica]MBD2503884.1 hypothetical protein [Anabaena azotica FACHB-119]
MELINNSTIAMSIGLHLLFQVHRLNLSEEIRFYLDVAQDLKFLCDWDLLDNKLILIYSEGTTKLLDPKSPITCEFLKGEVELFCKVISTHGNRFS